MPDEEEGHVILCGECGMAAMVPFKPREGRQVFCPTCHRRRRHEEYREGNRRPWAAKRGPGPQERG